jgi:hypothetical protein
VAALDERVAAAARLVGSVRGAVAARRGRVHDVNDHEQVHWLAELPGEVHVQADAGPGHALFSMPPIALSPPAPLGEEFDSWLVLRRWYRVLRALAEAPDDTELVLGAGLLTWRSGTARVRDHLLTTPVRVEVDTRTERVDVVLGRETTLRDADLLSAQPGFDKARTEWVGDAVRAGQGFGLRASVVDVLRKWCELAFDQPAVFREDWTALADGGYQGASPRVRLAPALVLRKRERTGVLDYFDVILADLARPGATAPAGLLHLVEGGPRPARPVHDPLFPLPAESAERQIMAGLRDALPVQGRLTTRSLANLGAALLAEGQRVLFVTPRNVRDVLPGEIAELFGALPLRSPDPARQKRVEAVLAGQVTAARREVAELREAAAASGAPAMGPGYQGTAAEIAARVADRADAYSWLPVGLPAVPPITAAEARELYALLATQTPARAARTAQDLPDPSALPAVPEVAELVAADRAARDRQRRSETDLSRRLWGCELAVRAGLSRCAITIRRALRELGSPVSEWDTDDWAVRALADGLAGRNTDAWERIAANAPLVTEADRAVRVVGFQSVRLPAELTPEMLAAARRLRSFLVAGGKLKRGPMKPEEQRRAEPLLSVARVDGEPPTTTVQLDIVIAEASGRMACRRLAECWSAAGVGFSGTSLGAVVDQIAAAYARLNHVRAALAAIVETVGLLTRAGVLVTMSSGPEVLAYLAALDSLRYTAEAVRCEAAVAELRDRLERVGGPENRPPELTAAIAAITARDADAYAECLARLGAAHRERREQARCDELMSRLPPAVGSLLAAGGASGGVGGRPPSGNAAPDAPDAAEVDWPARLAGWDEAWAWSAAAEFVGSLEHQDSAELADASARERAAVTELIAARGRRLTSGTPLRAVLLEQVASVVEPIRDAFDVVIVDEADATDVSALFLLWLAPIVIAIGFPDPQAGSSPMRGSLFDVLAARCGPVLRLAANDSPSQPAPPLSTPQPAPPQPPSPPSAGAPTDAAPSVDPDVAEPVQSGPRSIATYKRAELLEIVARAAADGVPRDDDELVAAARALLDCPPDEELLVGARLHYAVSAFRQRQNNA